MRINLYLVEDKCGALDAKVRDNRTNQKREMRLLEYVLVIQI